MNDEGQQIKTKTATVLEALPNTKFRISFDDPELGQGIGFLSGRMRRHRIRVMIGDRVEVFLDPNGGQGRIERRL